MKVLILSASPQRDALIDEMIKNELTKRGHQVWVRPCLREGRDSVLELKPDTLVVPPIRQPYSRDFVEVCRGWGIKVLSRHTEASCDWQDWKQLDNRQKTELVGGFPYMIETEIVWGEDEAQILNRRGTGFPAVSVGAFVVDVYKCADFVPMDHANFCTKFKLDPEKKTLLISSPWGFADSAPDLQIDDVPKTHRDIQCRNMHLNMIAGMKNILTDWNILVTLHPGVVVDEYKKVLGQIGIPMDTDSKAFDLLHNSDALIHSGSTMAIEMHFLNKPAFQYGDVNTKLTAGWWLGTKTPLSKVSPTVNDIEKLAKSIARAKPQSNASKKSLRLLETGRYGKMDGRATERAADIIEKNEGSFKLSWPKAHRNYDTIAVFKESATISTRRFCGVCKNSFEIINRDYLNKMADIMGYKGDVTALYSQICPNCGARFYHDSVYNTGKT